MEWIWLAVVIATIAIFVFLLYELYKILTANTQNKSEPSIEDQQAKAKIFGQFEENVGNLLIGSEVDIMRAKQSGMTTEQQAAAIAGALPPDEFHWWNPATW